LITNVDVLIKKLKIEDAHLIIALLGAILLFYIEFIGNGLITTLFKTTFQTKDNGVASLMIFIYII